MDLLSLSAEEAPQSEAWEQQAGHSAEWTKSWETSRYPQPSPGTLRISPSKPDRGKGPLLVEGNFWSLDKSFRHESHIQ
jgi:hypothetical protein